MASRVYLDLRDEGVLVGKRRIARLMRADGLRGADGSRDRRLAEVGLQPMPEYYPHQLANRK